MGEAPRLPFLLAPMVLVLVVPASLRLPPALTRLGSDGPGNRALCLNCPLQNLTVVKYYYSNTLTCTGYFKLGDFTTKWEFPNSL